MNETKEQKTNWVMILLWLALGLIVLGLALWFRPSGANASLITPNGAENGDECVDVYAPEPVTQSINVAKRGTIMATFQWFEEPEGTWTLKLDTDPRGGVENWVTEYPNKWEVLFTKPMELPQTITEYACPKPVCPTWTCGECQDMYELEAVSLKSEENSCKKQKQYCEKEYGCKEVCPTEDKCTKDEKVWECNCPPEPTPTPEVTPVPEQSVSKPEGCTENCHPAACTEQTPQPVVNPHIYRKGDCAIVKYWPTSDKVNIYWRLNSSGGWEHSLADQPATGNHDICGLNSYDYTFGVQSVSGCAADGVVNASNLSVIVDGNTNGWMLFR